jgi:hypothetical protein
MWMGGMLQMSQMSQMWYLPVTFYNYIQAFKHWIWALYPTIGQFSLDVICLEFPRLRQLYEHGRLLLHNDEMPEIEKTFVDAYTVYIREQEEKEMKEREEDACKQNQCDL